MDPLQIILVSMKYFNLLGVREQPAQKLFNFLFCEVESKDNRKGINNGDTVNCTNLDGTCKMAFVRLIEMFHIDSDQSAILYLLFQLA